MRKRLTHTIVKKTLKDLSDPKKATILKRFFKTKKGEYGEGDKFLGVMVPIQRKIASEFKELSLIETEKLLHGKFHEERMTALLILIFKFKVGEEAERKDIFELYKRNTKNINSWDLVDISASNIIGEYLKDKDRKILYKYARSKCLWDRRISVVSTLAFVRKGDFFDALKISEKLLRDKQDLIHKAVGWVLREVSKRCGEEFEEYFLQQHYKTMPRTMLRYAIERFPEKKRKAYLNGEITKKVYSSVPRIFL